MHKPPARPINDPQPGTYRMRLVRRGPMVAALIERSPETLWRASIAGEAKEWTADFWTDPWLPRVWEYGHPIPQAEYDYLVARHVWARQHAPDSPEANPSRPIDLNTLPPLF